jgi:cholesterol 7-dehydrogenase
VARDVMIWNNKQFINNPLLPKEDKQIKMFRNWFGQFYTENSKTFASVSENLEW